jgi:GTP-binding protein
MADIPGLIEGASKGKGLGHQFLKHIERNKILLFLIDVEEKNPNEVYNQLLDELVNFNKDLLDKDRIVVRTKIDTISEDVDERWSSFSEEFIDISSVSNTGLNSLKDKLVSFLSA